MKNLSKFLLSLVLFGTTVSSCATKNKQAVLQLDSSEITSSETDYSNDARYPIYILAVEAGFEGTYEEWLATIKGADGQTPYIGENGNWWIGETDTGVKARGEDGKSAYELYCEAHPEYTGTEQKWLDDLLNGRLGNKQSHTVTFDTKGGGTIPSQNIMHGEKVTQPSNPSLEGYDFLYWSYKGERWSFVGYVVTEDITLVAEYEQIMYTVHYCDDDGHEMYYTGDHNFPYGTDFAKYYEDHYNYYPPCNSVPPLGQKYIFDGWNITINEETRVVTCLPKFKLAEADKLFFNGVETYIQDNNSTREYVYENVPANSELEIYCDGQKVNITEILFQYGPDVPNLFNQAVTTSAIEYISFTIRTHDIYFSQDYIICVNTVTLP